MKNTEERIVAHFHMKSGKTITMELSALEFKDNTLKWACVEDGMNKTQLYHISADCIEAITYDLKTVRLPVIVTPETPVAEDTNDNSENN